ncbi:peroxiredoxin [Qipengyuania sp. GH1]|uniref:peroxiredoxin n=1 Tax=Qipengyuania aestuarii TaxID=2867241 RepID=UPI001C87160E|nr:peroxiredoxin [Qipengyuania aestuarii]MBX7536732.1 peroxiredoxin [Qipengyuania aestuarii]
MTTYAEGDAFPEFTMETPDGGTVTKADLLGKKTVIFFYPKDNTPGCTTEAKDFSALKSEFEKAGTQLLGVSKDSARKHQNFIAKHDLTVDLATDAEEAGLSDELGIWGEKKNYGRTYMGMIRSTYFLDAEGKILRIWPKVRVKDHAAEVLAAAQGA